MSDTSKITITDIPTPPSDPGELLAWLESRRYWLSGQHVEGLWSVHTGPNVVLGFGMTPIDALRAAYVAEAPFPDYQLRRKSLLPPEGT